MFIWIMFRMNGMRCEFDYFCVGWWVGGVRVFIFFMTSCDKSLSLSLPLPLSISISISVSRFSLRSPLRGNWYLNIPVPSPPTQKAFHKRITFCLDVHNEAVRAMRYPPNAYKKELDKARPDLEDEKTDEELAKEIEDEMNEEDGGL